MILSDCSICNRPGIPGVYSHFDSDPKVGKPGEKPIASKRAHEAAVKLADQLGVSWVPRVWENLGWWYEVTNGNARVAQSGKRRFSAQIALKGTSIHANGSTPLLALRKLERIARAELCALATGFNSVAYAVRDTPVKKGSRR